MVSFQSLHQWGTEPYKVDLVPDEDSVVVTAFMQVCNAGTANVELKHEVKRTLTGAVYKGYDVYNTTTFSGPLVLTV